MFYAISISLHRFMYPGYLPDACRDQEKTSDDLELELWMVVIHVVAAANWMCELFKSYKCS